jgi:hypothetical protein
VRGQGLVEARVADPDVSETSIALAVERVGLRAGPGALVCTLEQDATRSDREFEAPPLFLMREHASRT